MRTQYCGNIKKIHLNKSVKLCGWVYKIRNFSKFIFIDMRDCTGLIQIIFDAKDDIVFKKAKNLRNEFCIQVCGIVKQRQENNRNFSIPTGDIEILVSSLNVLNSSKPLPLNYINENNEDSRLKYRYLDLRRANMLNNLKIRNNVNYIIRTFLTKKNFLDVETPILTKSTPEGARDYLVPSRNHYGKFYALPQSPQLFKQLLMISGIDKYYQIVKCFRDEDLRSHRQPEFTQLDIEISFMNSKKIRKLIETLIKKIWLKTINCHLKNFPIISYHDAIKTYGTDKPDLRNPIKIIDISEMLKDKKIMLFFNLKNNIKNKIAFIYISQENHIDKEKIKYYDKKIKKYTSKQLFYLKIKKSNVHFYNISNTEKKIFNEKIVNAIIKKSNGKHGDVVFFLADIENIVNKTLSFLSKKIAHDFNLIDPKNWKPVWITHFPMFKRDIKGKLSTVHHPFSSIKKTDLKKMKKYPDDVRSDSYDLVINGYEIGGGSIRIHDVNIQKQVFDILGMGKEQQNSKFGFLIEALQYGAPPHAGIALGLDRLIMLLTNCNNIRDVIAFPKTTSASCLLTNSPDKINVKTLQELNLQIIKNKK